MAIRLTTVRNTNQETIIHFASEAIESTTISLDSISATTQVRNLETPSVNIARFVTTGEVGSSVTVLRNNNLIISTAPENCPFLDFTTMGIGDSQESSFDIIISNNVNKKVTGYITLRKVAGWDTKFEPATYGAYDDEMRVGASLTKSGSPDKV